jgi:hypothetical protein
VFKASPKESDKPDVSFSLLLPTTGARVLAVTDKLVAIAQPDPSRVTVYDSKGDEVGEYPVQVPEQGFAGDPTGRIVSTAQSGAAVYWFTGTDTIALSVTDFHPLWTVQGSLGAGTLFAGRLLIPVPDGLAVCDPSTGERVGTIAVNRGGYTGEVTMNTLGPMVFEQRGDTLVALH